MRRIVLAVTALCGLGGGVWFAFADGAAVLRGKAVANTPPRQVFDVTTHLFAETIIRRCHIDYGAPAALSAPVDGSLSADVSDGAFVPAGTVIASYDRDKLQSDEKLARLDLGNLKAQLAFKTGPALTEKEAIRQLEWQDADETLKRQETLLSEIADLERKGKIAPSRVEEAQLKRDAAAKALTRLRHQQSFDRAQEKLDIDALHYNIARSEQALAEIDKRLEAMVLRAPDAGRVVFADPHFGAAEAAQVRAGAKIADLVQPDLLGATVRIDDADMAVVENADVTVLFAADQAARKAKIATTRLVNDTLEQRRGRYAYDVDIVFAAEHGADLLHSQAVCRFSKPLGGPEPAIPADALRFEAGKAYVQRLDAGGQTLVHVVPGEVDGQFVRILSGLKPGERVLEQ
ncbi:HlyD family efflux transporter periplasmic adaptor subunit [Martelella sp. HB161492]|uniref:efflux RND transporter periplasmic adaptor subunit n=1 Tax=Martelella sp. HB161492 TaxID=2720726 RepID=UPI001591766E|nr:HlyD family efflux transporter periplasmic adaptor subunit [Martelella sp. HB161492]